MNELMKFKADVKSLNNMLIIQMLLESFIVLIIAAMLTGLKFDEDLVLIISSLITSCLVTYYLVKHYQKKFNLKISCKTKTDLNVITFFKFVVMALGAAWLTSSVLDFIMEIISPVVIFETPDLSIKDSFTTNIFLIIYTVIVAPITEELLFRGILLGKLKQYGKVSSVIVVSLLFGLLHGNIPQAIPTFVVSLFLCYITLKSNSIFPAILIHMINNAVAQLTDINNDIFQILMNIMIIIIIVAGVFLIIKEYKTRPKYKPEYKVMAYFKNVAGIIILILSLLMILESIRIV